MKESIRAADCLTCYGKGEVVDDYGPSPCPDCGGGGKQLDASTQVEWRLRDIEGGHIGAAHGCEADVRWLAFELRRARAALLQIVSRSQDADENDQLARDVRLAAIEALSLYQRVTEPPGAAS
jgi:hypothetical protein